MPIKHIKLNYRPAIVKSPPIGEIEIPGDYMEELDRAIRRKTRQNASVCTDAVNAVKEHIVR